jgi:hypothetical protein
MSKPENRAAAYGPKDKVTKSVTSVTKSVTSGKRGGYKGGSRKGIPNKLTADVRAAIALIAQRNIGPFEQWLQEIKDPAKRCDIYLRAIEYHVPKLARTELTGKDGGAIVIQAQSEDDAI